MLVTYHHPNGNVSASISVDAFDIQRMIDKEEVKYSKLEFQYDKVCSRLTDSFFDKAPKHLIDETILESFRLMKLLTKSGEQLAYYENELVKEVIPHE